MSGLNTIRLYDGSPAAQVPTVADYVDAGVLRVTEIIVTPVNSFIALKTQTEKDTAAEIQAIVDAYRLVYNLADGVSNSAAEPSIAQYELLEIVGINTTEKKTLLGDILDVKTFSEVSSFSQLQSLATAVSNVHTASIGLRPSIADMQLLGLLNVNDSNIAAIQSKLSTISKSGIDTRLELVNFINTIVSQASAALSIIINYNGTALTTAPTVATYEDAGVFNVNTSRLSYINAIIGTTTTQSKNTVAEIQSIVNSCIKILGLADGIDNNGLGLAAADYLAVSIPTEYVSTQQKLNLLNDILDVKVPSDIDSVSELLTIAASSNKVISAPSSNQALTITDLQNIGISNVDPIPFPIFQQKVNVIGASGIDTIAKINSLLADTEANYYGSLDIIKRYDGTTNSITPILSNFTDIGVSGVTSQNISAINSSLAIIPEIASDEPSEIQAVVNSYNSILAAADSAENDSGAALTANHYQQIGVLNVDTPQKLSLINDIIDRLGQESVNTVGEIQEYVNALNLVINYNGDNQAPTAEDFELIGITPGLVNADNLPIILEEIRNLPDEISTIDEIEDFILDALFENAMNIISNYDGSNQEPTVENFETINVTGVTEDNLGSINSSLAQVPANLSNSTQEVQAIVNNYLDVLELADGEQNSVSYPGLIGYETIGVTGLTTQTAKILGSVIDSKPRNSVDTLNEIQGLANSVLSFDAAFNSSTQLDQGDIDALGLVQIDEASSSEIFEIINEVFNPGSSIDTIQEIQQLIDSAVAYRNSLNTISTYGDPGWQNVPTANDYDNVTVTLPEEELLNPINSAVFELDSNETNTPPKIQQVVDSFSKILNFIDGQSQTPPTKADYEKIGIAGVPDETIATFLTEILKGGGYSNSDAVEKIQSALDPILKIISHSNGSQSEPPTSSDFAAIGIPGIVNENVLTLVNSVINDKPQSAVNSQQKVKTITDSALNIINSVLLNDQTLATTVDYGNLGISKIDSNDKVSLINSFISKQNISNISTTDSLSSIATVVDDVISSIGNRVPVTLSQLQALGIIGVSSTSLPEIQWAILNGSPSSINTVDKIQGIVTAINNRPIDVPVPEPIESGVTENYKLDKYTLPEDQCVGSWEISSLTPDECATNERRRQESYVAEVLNISGAPINIFKLLGVHEQGEGSQRSQGTLISSQPYPGFPVSNILNNLSWKSFDSGANVILNGSYLGIDFGVKRLENGALQYAPIKSNFKDVGAITITQSGNINSSAKQVAVQIADGSCEAGQAVFSGAGAGTLTLFSIGLNAVPCTIRAIAISSTEFNVFATVSGAVTPLGVARVGIPFNSTFANFGISQTQPFSPGDMFTFLIQYKWKREGIFNLNQTGASQTLNLNKTIKVRALRIIPTLYTGTSNWEVLKLDFLDAPITNINNIQDLFFNENRDRDYAKSPILIKAQYSPTDSASDLARFGLNILDQYTFTVSFSSMVRALGRPIVVGDIIEVIPELQYDQNLMPVRKFLEVSDTGWAAEGFGPQWNATLYRFSAQQALPSQETRDIFGTVDTQKYITPDAILADNVAEQIDITPLTQLEEIIKAAADAVPETGSDDARAIDGVPVPKKKRSYNRKTQPEPAPTVVENKTAQGSLIEDGMPPNGLPFTEGFKLPDIAQSTDGQYFRLNYPPETKIPTRLYRFSAIKNRWIYQETDRRGEYSSHKPSVRNILDSDTKQSLKKKL